ILPFEQPYFRSHGVNATFVGHPLFAELPPHRDPPPVTVRFPNKPAVIGLLPGSRKSVAAANFPGLLEVAQIIRQSFPDVSFLIPTTAATDETVRAILRSRVPAEQQASFRVGLNGFDDRVPECDLCLTVSGTATLHVA